jgi:serine/threonine-protein kinase HipA
MDKSVRAYVDLDGKPHLVGRLWAHTRKGKEIVDVLRRYGAAPKRDMEALWRRIIFNIMISNTDDHLRNHGFLYEGPDGWRLSPAYDLNPVPVDIKPRVLTTSINEDDGTVSLDLAMEVAEYFELDASAARKIARQTGGAVLKWRSVAKQMGVKDAEIDRMASAFDRANLQKAAKVGRRQLRRWRVCQEQGPRKTTSPQLDGASAAGNGL